MFLKTRHTLTSVGSPQPRISCGSVQQRPRPHRFKHKQLVPIAENFIVPYIQASIMKTDNNVPSSQRPLNRYASPQSHLCIQKTRKQTKSIIQKQPPTASSETNYHLTSVNTFMTTSIHPNMTERQTLPPEPHMKIKRVVSAERLDLLEADKQNLHSKKLNVRSIYRKTLKAMCQLLELSLLKVSFDRLVCYSHKPLKMVKSLSKLSTFAIAFDEASRKCETILRHRPLKATFVILKKNRRNSRAVQKKMLNGCLQLAKCIKNAQLRQRYSAFNKIEASSQSRLPFSRNTYNIRICETQNIVKCDNFGSTTTHSREIGDSVLRSIFSDPQSNNVYIGSNQNCRVRTSLKQQPIQPPAFKNHKNSVSLLPLLADIYFHQ